MFIYPNPDFASKSASVSFVSLDIPKRRSTNSKSFFTSSKFTPTAFDIIFSRYSSESLSLNSLVA